MKNYFEICTKCGQRFELPASRSAGSNYIAYEAEHPPNSSELVFTELRLYSQDEDGPMNFDVESITKKVGEYLRWEVTVVADESGKKEVKCVAVGHREVWTDLDKAAQAGDAAEVRRLLAAGANPNEGGLTGYGWTPLHLAAKSGSLEIVSALLEAGAAVDAASTGGHGDRVGVSPLHEAVESGQYSIVDALIRAGAEVNAICWVMRLNSRFESPLDIALRLDHKRIAELVQMAGGKAAIQH